MTVQLKFHRQWLEIYSVHVLNKVPAVPDGFVLV